MTRTRSILLALGVGLLTALASTPARAQQTVMITEQSRLEDASGSPLSREEFIERMESGRYRPIPLTDDSGKTIGYRLVPRDGGGRADADRGQRPAPEARRIRSSRLDGPTTVEMIRHRYLFLPIDIHDGRAWHEHLVVLDTGTFVPLILDPQLGIDRVERARIDGVEFTRPPTGRFEPFDIVRDMNRFRDERPELFGDRRIVGIAGVSLLSNYLVSIDAAASELTLRPLDSERRHLLDAEPVASVSYDTQSSNIWLPITINGVEGFAHYDTGSPYTHVLPRILELAGGRVEEAVVGSVDLAAAPNAPAAGGPDAEAFPARPRDLGLAYQSVPLEVIAQLGTEGSDRWIITIDPRDNRLYFERR